MSNAPSREARRDTLAFAYEGSKQIHVADKASCEALGRMEIEQVGATDRLDIFVFGNERTGQARLIAALDNLGKGAEGADVQNLNILAGLDAMAGLSPQGGVPPFRESCRYTRRSDAPSGGKEWVRTCRSRWSPHQ